MSDEFPRYVPGDWKAGLSVRDRGQIYPRYDLVGKLAHLLDQADAYIQGQLAAQAPKDDLFRPGGPKKPAQSANRNPL